MLGLVAENALAKDQPKIGGQSREIPLQRLFFEGGRFLTAVPDVELARIILRLQHDALAAVGGKTNAVQVVVSLNIVTTRNHANFSPVDDVVNANPGTRLPGSPITVRRERWAAHALILEPDLQLLSLAHIPNANAFGRQRCDSSAVG